MVTYDQDIEKSRLDNVRPSVRLSVCLSVCLSVRPSVITITQKFDIRFWWIFFFLKGSGPNRNPIDFGDGQTLRGWRGGEKVSNSIQKILLRDIFRKVWVVWSRFFFYYLPVLKLSGYPFRSSKSVVRFPRYCPEKFGTVVLMTKGRICNKYLMQIRLFVTWSEFW